LFDRYQEIVDTEPNPLERLKGPFMASFDAIEHRYAQVVIYQDDAKRLSSQPRFSYVEELNRKQRKMWVDVLNQGIEEATSGRISMSIWCTGSSATPPGFRPAGISPADL
jgi:TetR/AcrR family transcriptional regulator, cholesterol catabolism regulator